MSSQSEVVWEMSSDGFGREGPGLTQIVYRRVLNRVASGQGSSFILLLPTRALVQKVIRHLLEALEWKAAGGMRILTLDAFVSRIAGLERRQDLIVDGTAREALLDAVLEKERAQGRAQYLGEICEFPGTTWSIGRLISELLRAGISPEELKAAAQTVRGQLSGAEVPRLWDMATIYEAYQGVLESKGLLDPEARYAKAIEVLKESGRKILAGVDALYFDGFYYLSPVQGKLICELVKNVEEYIFALEDPVSGEFKRIIEATRKHACGIEVHLAPPAARHLAHRLFGTASYGGSQHSAASSGGESIPELRLISGPDPAGEVRAVAKEIKQLSPEPARVCLVVRDQEAYVPVIERVFFEEGIPLDGGWSFALNSNPAVRAVLVLLDAAASRQQLDLLRIMKSDYLVPEKDIASEVASAFPWTRRGASKEEWIDMLEKEARKAKEAAEAARARNSCGDGGAEFETGEAVEGDDELELAGTVTAERLEKRASALERALNWAANFFDVIEGAPERGRAPDFSAWLWKALDRLGFKQSIVAPLSESSDELTKRTVARDWAAFCELERTVERVAAVSELAGKGTLSLSQWVSEIHEAVADSTYRASAPCAGGVQVISPSQAVGLEFDVVFIVGLADGVFPKTVQADWVFTEGIRKALRATGIDLGLSSELARYEKFLFFLGVRMASKMLYLCYPEAEEDGTASLRSDFVAEALRAAGVRDKGAAVVHRRLDISEVVPARWEDITTDRELGLRVARDLWADSARTPHDREEARELAAAYAFWHPAEWRRLCTAADIEDSRAAGAPSQWNGRVQDPRLLSRLAEKYNPRFVFGVSPLNDYAECPFKYFIKHELRLAPLEEVGDEADIRIQGIILHRILHLVMDRYRGKSLGAIDPDEARAAVEAAAARAFEEAEAGGFRMRPSLMTIFRRRVTARARDIVLADIERGAKFGGEIKPRLLEWGFGLGRPRGPESQMDPSSDPKPLEIDSGQERVRVSGKVDRVDEVAGQDGPWYVVYDYKQGKAEYQRKVDNALALQPALYAAAVSRAVGEVRAAAFYSIKQKKITSGIAREDAIGALGWTRKKTGLYPADMMDEVIRGTLAKVVEYARGIRSGAFTPEPRGEKACDFCPAKDICRYVRVSSAEAEQDADGGEADGDS